MRVFPEMVFNRSNPNGGGSTTAPSQTRPWKHRSQDSPGSHIRQRRPGLTGPCSDQASTVLLQDHTNPCSSGLQNSTVSCTRVDVAAESRVVGLCSHKESGSLIYRKVKGLSRVTCSKESEVATKSNDLISFLTQDFLRVSSARLGHCGSFSSSSKVIS